MKKLSLFCRGALLATMAAASLPLAFAQTAPVQHFAYEAVAIKPNTDGRGNNSVNMNGNSLIVSHVELKWLLQHAFGLQRVDQLAGLPAWAETGYYDINAKMDEDTAARLKQLTPKERQQADEEMLRTLFVERFGLKVHHELREMPEYALVQARGGARLKAATPDDPKAGTFRNRTGAIEGFSTDMNTLAFFLAMQVQRNVINRTGLTGEFDLKIDYTPDDANSAADGAAHNAPGLFTALQEQLGLKLEAIKGPVDTVVVDHIEHPSEN